MGAAALDEFRPSLPVQTVATASFGSAGAFAKARCKDKEDQDARTNLLPVKIKPREKKSIRNHREEQHADQRAWNVWPAVRIERRADEGRADGVQEKGVAE
jgi:hypothetical protein